MTHCDNCDHKNPEDAKFCESCGEKLVMGELKQKLTPCKDCGKEISKNAELCPNCGIRLRKTKQQDHYITKGITTRRDVWVAAALGFFLGPFGYLYLGRYGLCFLMFICGIIIVATLGFWAAPVLWVLWAFHQYMIAKEINEELSE